MKPLPRLPDYADIEDAARLLNGVAVETPLLESAALNERLGGRLLVKAEWRQLTGSFKFRGAYNRLARLSDNDRKAGVVAFSSGNHAQGVAKAAGLLGMPATIVMPSDAPAIKLDNTRALGAKVVLYDRARESREAIAGKIVAETGAVLVPPFDDTMIIAGQGTCGLELARQAEALGVPIGSVLVPASGGGLVAGIATAIMARSPRTDVYSVEPAGHDDLARSLKAGRRQSNEPGIRSICDALLVETPGEVTFLINNLLLAGGIAVPDSETIEAMKLALAEFHIALEPSGAIALAAALGGHLPVRDRVVAVICSGGNVDPDFFQRITGAKASA